MGYVGQIVNVGKQDNLVVTMVDDSKMLNEVVVVGYGVQKKVDLTGAIATVGNKELSMKPTGQLSSTLQGLAPGVTITTNTGQPGLDVGKIRIRGCRDTQ